MNKGEMSAYRLKRQCLLEACKRLRRKLKRRGEGLMEAANNLSDAQRELAAMRRRYYAPEPESCGLSWADWAKFRRS